MKRSWRERNTVDQSDDRGVVMTSIQPQSPYRPASRLLIMGAVLTMVGGVIGLAGATVTVAAAAAVARRRIENMEVAPSEMARQQWRRARTAVSAGAGAWRDGQSVPAATTN
jgi:hypothetical protein